RLPGDEDRPGVESAVPKIHDDERGGHEHAADDEHAGGNGADDGEARVNHRQNQPNGDGEADTTGEIAQTGPETFPEDHTRCAHATTVPAPGRSLLLQSGAVSDNSPSDVPQVRVLLHNLDPDLPAPSYAHPDDAGADLRARTGV